ncbi:hypothetical protein [Salipaludibacillus keqinensis]|uniref:hypothetical protein n=1 Tax=Salipaludibacillus keqinensis TaxID=2045207 RepID=UPI00130502B2|nr:hypothetical protein [Salipaludibacillus keqinensis]
MNVDSNAKKPKEYTVGQKAVLKKYGKIQQNISPQSFNRNSNGFFENLEKRLKFSNR